MSSRTSSFVYAGLAVVAVALSGCGSGSSGPAVRSQAAGTVTAGLDAGDRQLTIACPSSLTCTLTPDTLWPPNHDLETIAFSVTAPCGTVPVRAITVYSNEADDVADTGDDHFSPDAKLDVTRCVVNTLKLRSERLGNGDGRVYLVVFTTDGGNVACTVVVPHSQSKADIDAVNAAAEAALEQFNGGTAPANFTPVPFVQVGTGDVIGPKQ